MIELLIVFVPLCFFFLIGPPVVAAKKGYAWYPWILTGILGICAVFFLPNINRGDPSAISNLGRRRRANILGAALSMLSLVCMVWRAFDLRKESQTRQATANWETLDKQTRMLVQQGDFSSALLVAQNALDAAEKSGPENVKIAQSLNNLAVIYQHAGRHDLAEPMLKRALQINQKLLGGDNLEVALNYCNLAYGYDATAKVDLADMCFRRSLTIYELPGQPYDINIHRVLNGLGRLLQKQGKNEGAEASYRKSLSLGEQHLGRYHVEVGHTLADLGLLYHNSGREALATECDKRVAEIQRRTR